MPYKDKARRFAYQSGWVQKRRLKWLEENGPCAKCGASGNLEVDHLDPELKISHRIWSWSEKRREEELKKCQILCGSCHLKKTAEWRASRIRPEEMHGTCTGYMKYKCRCEKCREYKRLAHKREILRRS